MKYLLIILLLSACNTKNPQTVVIAGMEMKTMPGLTADDINRYFAANGFSTELKAEAMFSVWTSTKPFGSYDLVVSTTGKDPSRIVAVDAYFKRYAKEELNEPALQFLGSAAMLPYTNAKPILAKQWAISHGLTGGDTTIGDVSFRLINSGDSARALKMSVGSWR